MKDARGRLYVALCAIFVCCLVVGDVIGGKTTRTPLGPVSVGILPFPVTFLLTDVVNDFYGRSGARFLTWLGLGTASLAWVLLQLTTAMPPDPSTYFTQAEYGKIFGGSANLFLASIVAYLIGQFLDIHLFQVWKALTESKHLWLRATGSTVVSQLVDTITINVIFWSWSAAQDPTSFLGRLDAAERRTWIGTKIGREYGIKLIVAVALTPVIYALHGLIVRALRIEPELHESRAEGSN
jgi:uncharacterized integral membrane protein (TIGR00697 family)